MNIVDLSHKIHNEIPVFSESESPQITTVSTHEEEGYAQKKLILFSHNSTHVDAPYHILQDMPSLDQLPLESFYGPGLVADCRNCGAFIQTEDLVHYENKLIQAEFLLLMTGWSKKWNSHGYKTGFPALSTEAAEWLMQFRLKGIGLDAISIDKIESTELPVHHIVLGNKLIIIENLANLEALLNKDFIFSCFPLSLEKSDGSPVRAVGIIA